MATPIRSLLQLTAEANLDISYEVMVQCLYNAFRSETWPFSSLRSISDMNHGMSYCSIADEQDCIHHHLLEPTPPNVL